MINLSIWLDPRARGLTPYRVIVHRPASSLLPSMLDEGFIFRWPARDVEAIVWAEDEADIERVLRYHYWDDSTFDIVGNQSKRASGCNERRGIEAPARVSNPQVGGSRGRPASS